MEQSDFKGDSIPIFKDDPIDFKRTGIRFGNSGQFYMLMNNSGLTYFFQVSFFCQTKFLLNLTQDNFIRYL